MMAESRCSDLCEHELHSCQCGTVSSPYAANVEPYQIERVLNQAYTGVCAVALWT